MSEAHALKKTVLHPLHTALGGKLVDFGGWEMPLWYPGGAIAEHLAVVRSAGLFDTSHMSVLVLEGPNVRAFLNYAVSKDISTLKVGRVSYGVILDENGYVLDDTIVYPLSEERFAVVLNAGKNETIISHFRSLPGGGDFRYVDFTGKLAKLDLQGPESFRILQPLFKDSESVFADLRYFGFKGDFDLSRSTVFLSDGTPVLISRSGYTGELGFEIFIAPEKAASFWNTLLENPGVTCCGLAARDSLRVGAVLPLSGQDIGNWPFLNTPWSFALPCDAEGKFTKDFHGRKALEANTENSYTLPFVGFDPRKVDPHEASVFLDDERIGTVLTAVADMAIGRVENKIMTASSPDAPENWTPRGLVCGFLKIDRPLEPGTTVQLKDNRRSLKVEIATDIRPNRTARVKL